MIPDFSTMNFDEIKWRYEELYRQHELVKGALAQLLPAGSAVVWVVPGTQFTRKISLIKGVRNVLPNVGLKEAKDFVEGSGRLTVTKEQMHILGIMFELDGSRTAFKEVSL